MKHYSRIYFFILFSIFFTLLSSSAQAAQVFFGLHNKNVPQNTKFETGVFLNTQNESVNAVEAQVTFDATAFEFNGFYNGNSILNFWVTQPKLLSPGVVAFSGIVPGGFAGPKGYLFSLLLTPKQQGSYTINSASEKILLNDGDGSQAPVTKAPITINVVGKSALQEFVPLDDTVAPETFVPQISNDATLFDGKYFLTFATQDKLSGMDEYQIMETPQWWSVKSLFSKSAWVTSESPYLLQDQSLQSLVYVKAVDRNGNATVVKVKAMHMVPLYENYIIYIIIVLISACFVLWKKRRTKKV